MRPTAIFPLLCALAALILALLCLFAGSSKSFLQGADLMTLNTSRLGHTSVFNTSDGDGGFFSNLENSLEGDINNLINNATSDIAQKLHIKDFYIAHVMDYCEGFYTPNSTVSDPSENITRCSNRTALFHFDPTKIIQSELAPGVNLTDLKWPDQIHDAVKAVEVASKVMFVFYCIGIAFAGLAVLGAGWGLVASGRITAFLNFGLDFMAFLALGIASAISTAIIVKAVNAINKYGNEIGIAASKGKEFMGMTWAATVVMLLASFLWIFECIIGHRKGHSYYSEKRY
ncbi:MAG: hypothetical protein Q9227_008588 [Pyrenula ochraceoflavens]